MTSAFPRVRDTSVFWMGIPVKIDASYLYLYSFFACHGRSGVHELREAKAKAATAATIRSFILRPDAGDSVQRGHFRTFYTRICRLTDHPYREILGSEAPLSECRALSLPLYRACQSNFERKLPATRLSIL